MGTGQRVYKVASVSFVVHNARGRNCYGWAQSPPPPQLSSFEIDVCCLATKTLNMNNAK